MVVNKGRFLETVVATLTKGGAAFGRKLLTLSPAVMISILSLGTSLVTLYLTQLHEINRLSALVTRLDIHSTDVKILERGVSFNITADIEFMLTNTGNLPAAVIKLFLIVGRRFDPIDCREVESARYSVEGLFGANEAFEFSIVPQVVASSSVVTVTGSLVGSKNPLEEGERMRSELGKTKYSCLAFLTMQANGKLKLTSIPAIDYIVDLDGQLGHLDRGTNHPINYPIDLVNSRWP